MTTKSPCTGICAIDPATDMCRGCDRSVDEIMRWGLGDDAERRAILDAVEARRRTMLPGTGRGPIA
ncbi:hypothetical protein GGQ80_001610 [Sphingomonas jinjuensis]|uniref:DUF1289 domain-containing protein n=1 Tax=Sphingomonas jinjuensis TaxID=535907 RepID=A0A840FD75_9SPHN|nr:DUF1289 domain-containing protein [Sphingomonas jinjuensis]MBB4153704.1 hypothetical protein [Sphingomonas jinjuensis]